MVVHACNPRFWEAGESWSKANPGKSTSPYLKNKLNAKGLRCGSHGRAPAQQALCPECKCHSLTPAPIPTVSPVSDRLRVTVTQTPVRRHEGEGGGPWGGLGREHGASWAGRWRQEEARQTGGWGGSEPGHRGPWSSQERRDFLQSILSHRLVPWRRKDLKLLAQVLEASASRWLLLTPLGSEFVLVTGKLWGLGSPHHLSPATKLWLLWLTRWPG
jgi:hypothetical protein